MQEGFLPDYKFWKDKRVLVTGHTGFKGAWLSIWLKTLGAKVSGFALEPVKKECVYNILNLESQIDSTIGDIRNKDLLSREMKKRSPDIVFHLAAQSLVLDSYKEPYETFDTNVMGTASLLEAVRKTKSVKAVVVVTTDKCYRNNESEYSYKEDDPLGGDDPYSASKACTEHLTNSYRESYFKELGVMVVSARAGNVFGGGDWADNRIVPDAVRAFSEERQLVVRNPNSVRPWQFVLEPLLGYLMLARACFTKPGYDRAFNFGPPESQFIQVGELATLLCRAWGNSASWESGNLKNVTAKEAGLLMLDSNLALDLLGWQSTIPLEAALKDALDWYKKSINESNHQKLTSLTENQIETFMDRIKNRPVKNVLTVRS